MGSFRKEYTVELQFEFGDYALQPQSGFAEALYAAGEDGRCESGAIDHDEVNRRSL